MPRITIKDIAAEAGVALGTASRALSGNGSIAGETRERVLAAARRLNYVPNAQARSLRSERTDTLGLLIPDVRNPFFSELAHGVEQEARQAGFSVVLCSADEDPQRMSEYALVLRRQRVDGIIVAPISEAHDTLASLQDADVPLVFVDRTIPGMGVPAAVSDTRSAIGAAVQHLVTEGARTIGYISGPSQTSTGVERLEEFTDAAAAAGIGTRIVHGDFQEDSGRLGMRELLASGADAVIASDSLMTLGALRECLDSGIVPVRDIPFIGFDDIPPFALLRPPLPLICQDVHRMAALAVELLTARLAGRDVTDEHRLPAQLRIPSTTEPEPVPQRAEVINDA